MLILVCREIKCCVSGNASRADGDSSALCHNGIGRTENEERKQNGFPNVEHVACYGASFYEVASKTEGAFSLKNPKNSSHGKQKAFLVDIRLKALGNIYVLAISPLPPKKKKKKNLR